MYGCRVRHAFSWPFFPVDIAALARLAVKEIADASEGEMSSNEHV